MIDLSLNYRQSGHPGGFWYSSPVCAMKGGPMYLSISSWSEPALAMLARLGVPVLGETVGLDETALRDPQPTTTNATSAVRATPNLDGWTRMRLTSVSAIIDGRH